MTGNGKHTTYKSGDDRGMVYDCFTLSIYIHTYIYIYPFKVSSTITTIEVFTTL